MSNIIIDALFSIAKKEYNGNKSNCYTIRAVWLNQYILKLTPNESTFNLKYIIVQTDKQGCCYVDAYSGGIDERIIGSNLLLSPIEDTNIMIAYLDAVFSSIIRKPDQEYTIEGSNVEKAGIRSKIVCDQVRNILCRKSPKNRNKLSIVNVGVVGGFLHNLTLDNVFDVKACDFYNKIIGSTIHGVEIENGTKIDSDTPGDRTIELIAEADLALVTGMTLATNTLEDIIATARENKTALVLFAETGSSFADEYCKMGVDIVISEPYPFYMICDGTSKINIYKKQF